MTTPVIMDLAVGAVLALFVAIGWKQGFVKSLAGLIIAVVALVGAAMLAGTFADPAAEYLAPIIRETVEERAKEAIADQTGAYDPAALEGSADEVLQMLGIDADARKELAQRAEEAMLETGESLIAAVVESITRSVVYALVFLVGFFSLLAVLHILFAAMDLVAKLPVLSTMNAFSGAVLGVMKGGLAVFLGIWVMRRTGWSFDTADVAQTYLMKFFAYNTPLSVLSLLL